MRTLVTAKQMKAVDAHTIHTIGIPSTVLRRITRKFRKKQRKHHAECIMAELLLQRYHNRKNHIDL